MSHTPPPYLCAVRVKSRGSVASNGSGLLVDADHVLTALHVLAMSDDRAPEAERDLDQPLPSCLGRADFDVSVAVGAGALRGAVWRPAEFIAEDLQNDLALLRLARPIRTVAPPPLANRRDLPGIFVFHGCRGGAFAAQETRDDRSTARYSDDGATLAAITLSADLPAGYSGGPVIEVAGDGGHRLWGLAAFGGIGAARAGFTGWGAIYGFLARCGRLSAFETLAGRTLSPGVPAVIGLPLAGRSLDFTPLGRDGQRFRARVPLSAAVADHLENRPPRPGSATLAAHVVEAERVAALLSALAAATGERLRLPSPDEAIALREAATETVVEGVGLPLCLPAYEASLAPPVGGVEWLAGTGGQPEAWHFRSDGEAPLAPGGRLAGHARFAVRPLLLGD